MSTVDKMLIKGIRSFDPENKHVITFFKPLTLIVGPNGAGKTTIIECLKYACTGELPPNARSGHSFINDPKVAGETETKAQIKLRFKTAAGKDVVCIRSFQLTQKASKMEYKAIESVLQTINPHTGEKICLSYRCADMDREIPALMGVSKAVLENVIFVHQDDANWPLLDPSTLKKKFDDIFSATRYTKALEVIKKLHKDQVQEIKTYKLKLENLHTLKDAVFKLRESITQDEEKTDSLHMQIQDLEKHIQDIENRIAITENALKELGELQRHIAENDARRSALFEQQQKQYAALAEENEDTDEELKEWQAKFRERIAQLDSKSSKLKRQMEDIEAEIIQLDNLINESLVEKGKLQAEADVHISVKQKRDSAIRALFVKHNLGSLGGMSLSDEMANDLIHRAKLRLMDLDKEFQDKKGSNEMKLNNLWNRYIVVNNQCSETEAQKKEIVEKKKNISNKLKVKGNELDDLESSIINLAGIDEREKNMQKETEKKIHQMEEKEFKLNISRKEAEKTCFEQRVKALQQEKDALVSDSEDRVKLGLRKEELENVKRKYKRIMDGHRDEIKTVLMGRLPPDHDVKKEITDAFGALKKEYDDLSMKSYESEKDVKLIEMKVDDVKNNLAKFNKDMDAKRRFIDSKLQRFVQFPFDIEMFPIVLHEAMEKRDVQKSKYNIADGMRQMFDPFERVARAHHICPCCERPFSPAEEDEFVKKQRVKGASSAEHVKLLGVESSTADSQFQQLDKLRMVYEEFVKLKNEVIPLAEKSLQELNQELVDKSQSYDDIVGHLAQLKSEKDTLEALVQQAEIADRLFHEVQTLEKQAQDLEYMLDTRGQGACTVEEIQSQINLLEEQKDHVTNDLRKLMDEQNSMMRELTNAQMRWQALREEKLRVSFTLEKIENAEKEIEQLNDEKAQVELEEKHLASDLIQSSKEKEKLLQDHLKLSMQLKQEYDELSDAKNNYQHEVEKILMWASEIKEYLDSKKGDKLKELEEKCHIYESKKHDRESKKQDVSAEFKKCAEVLMNQKELQRNIDDNLNYRALKAAVDKLSHEILLLEDKKENIGAISICEADLKKHNQERARLLSELHRCHGTMAVYQSNISKHKLELKQAQFNDIDKRYFNQLIQLKTTEMANKDLDRYYNALDKALMSFHTMKMEEINKIIRELWQQTYRGQDIDCLLIISDSEGSGTRSYSYRVVMQTGDAELEMRGRCSAGQKVLASLIIRLALAETFCLNCGILALDEPTTNLDGPNAESLAASLLRIMECRKGQENFQLIVITHDERFAQLIGQRQLAERYYRVRKDEHQHSIIEAQEIFE